MATNTQVKKTPTRNKRTPFGYKVSKLDVAVEIPGYKLRWINDENGRIHEAQEGGYQFVEPSEVGSANTEDTKEKRLVGKQQDGKPLFAYLMKLPLEFYEEDQELRRSEQKQIDDAIRGGSIGVTPGDNRYVKSVRYDLG